MKQSLLSPTLLEQVGQVDRVRGAALRVELLEGAHGRFVRISETDADGALRFRVHVRAGELRDVAVLLGRAADQIDPRGNHGRTD